MSQRTEQIHCRCTAIKVEAITHQVCLFCFVFIFLYLCIRFWFWSFVGKIGENGLQISVGNICVWSKTQINELNTINFGWQKKSYAILLGLRMIPNWSYVYIKPESGTQSQITLSIIIKNDDIMFSSIAQIRHPM